MVGMGKCYDQEHRTEKAIHVLEESLAKAKEIDGESERGNLVRTISKDLIEIYMKEAEQHEREDPTEETALMYLEKCLEVAKNSHEEDTEGRICFKIGELYYRAEQYKKSVTYQEKYLDLIKQQIEDSKKIND
jgi:tetratricopeptide (TPR) repeat protein